MFSQSAIDDRLDRLSEEIGLWLRDFCARHRPRSERFAGFLDYPLGWVDHDLRPLEPPAPSGKRLRPALCLLVAEAVGGRYRSALPPAGAIELIHNFSLVHDDIQDHSPLRRGRPTVWDRWGASQAINVGDSLFSLAQLALLDDEGTLPALRVEAAQALNRACLRLVEGQFLDLDLQDSGAATLEAYQSMVGGKTAALLECSARLGARYGGAQPEQANRFARFGRQLGLAFQYQDDWLGVWGDLAETGKSAETDLRTRKQALPALLALSASGSTADRFRAVFMSNSELDPDQAHHARLLLEQLGVREQVHQTFQATYATAEAELRLALQSAPSDDLTALLQRFRARRA
jgi:geranylgeranyl diphosphate synthase type I